MKHAHLPIRFLVVTTVLFGVMAASASALPQSGEFRAAKTASRVTSKKSAKTTAKTGGKPTSAAPQVKRVEVTETWSLKDTLDGWARIDDTSWPTSGKTLAVESRTNAIAVRQRPSVASPGLLFVREKWMAQPVTFLAIRDYGEWVQVQLPVRPNGTLGWVRGSDVSRIAVTTRIVVDLSTNLMYVENNGKQIARHPVSPGTGNTPTPTGLFYVRALIVQGKTDGPYGPFVWGLSGYSEVLNEFDGGAAGIAIHGTNRPDAIGTPASHGCIRLTNDIVTSLTKFLPLGTPVEVVKSLADLPTQRRALAQPDPDPVKEIQPGLVIDFPLQPVGIPDRQLEDVDVVDVTA